MEPNRPSVEEARGPSTDAVSRSPVPEALSVSETLADAERVPRARKSILREYAEAIVVAMLLAFAIRVFVVQAFKIPSGSMIPTLLIGDHILVSKLSYGLQWPQDCKFRMTFPPVTCYASRPLAPFGQPERGDVIVFRYPEDEDKDFIKRIVGLPGDTVEIRNKVVHVNGVPLDDRVYSQRIDPGTIDGSVNPRDNFGPVTVPEHSYFVMGDNRDQSLDSRFWGYVSANKIKGKAFRIYWSWSGQGEWHQWVRWERLGKAVR
ncbi:MAG: signal peptidase I [Nitrospirae bacterium]|nr:signal peptidase I [Nitrospirota bacterium]